MDRNEKEFFTLVDGHARQEYRCFLAEMFPDRTKEQYILCFRPAGVSVQSSNRYVCRYIKVNTAEVRNVFSIHKLSADLLAKLDQELMPLADIT